MPITLKGRNWCFTLNNFNEAEVTSIQAIECKYLCYGKEVGETGTPHLQGCIGFANPKGLSAVRRLINRAHWELTRGTVEQAVTYCKKDGDWFLSGTVPAQGKRTDLDSAIACLKEFGIKRVAEEFPKEFVKYSRGLRDLALTVGDPYEHVSVRGIWIYGPPGTGKSHAARRFDPDLYIKQQNKWWDGYHGQSVVLLDDLDTNVLGHYLKIWSDKYACTGETKGGTVQLVHKLFVVTSNYSPYDMGFDDVTCEAIVRRFKLIEKTERNQLVDFLILT